MVAGSTIRDVAFLVRHRSFVKKLNAAMPDILLPVKSNSPRIEESLQVKITMVAREYKINCKQCAGICTAEKFDKKVFKMSVLSSEVTHLIDLKANNEALVRELEEAGRRFRGGKGATLSLKSANRKMRKNKRRMSIYVSASKHM
jgi:hypothetical protein